MFGQLKIYFTFFLFEKMDHFLDIVIMGTAPSKGNEHVFQVWNLRKPKFMTVTDQEFILHILKIACLIKFSSLGPNSKHWHFIPS